MAVPNNSGFLPMKKKEKKRAEGAEGKGRGRGREGGKSGKPQSRSGTRHAESKSTNSGSGFLYPDEKKGKKRGSSRLTTPIDWFST